MMVRSFERMTLHYRSLSPLINNVFFAVELAEDFVNCGAMPHLLGLTQQSIHSNPVLCRMAVSAISQLMECGMYPLYCITIIIAIAIIYNRGRGTS